MPPSPQPSPPAAPVGPRASSMATRSSQLTDTKPTLPTATPAPTGQWRITMGQKGKVGIAGLAVGQTQAFKASIRTGQERQRTGRDAAGESQDSPGQAGRDTHYVLSPTPRHCNAPNTEKHSLGECVLRRCRRYDFVLIFFADICSSLLLAFTFVSLSF